MKNYCLKIQLKNAHVKIIREIVVPECIRFDLLSSAILDAMGWGNSHMHQYVLARHRYIQEEIDEDFIFPGDEVLDEKKTFLNDIVSESFKKFVFEYDFGDGWDHAVSVKSFDYTKEIPQPIYCLKAVGTCPPENVGGVGGYAEFCEAIRDPKNKEYKSLREWAEIESDDDIIWPDAVDLDAINRRLSRYSLAKKKKR